MKNLYTLYYLHRLNAVVNLGMLGKISSYPTYPIAVILKMAMHLEDPERTALRRGDTGGFFECHCVAPGSASRRLRNRSRDRKARLSRTRPTGYPSRSAGMTTKPSALVVLERIEAPLIARGSTFPSTSRHLAHNRPAHDRRQLPARAARTSIDKARPADDLQPPDDRSGEEVVGAEATDGVARQKGTGGRPPMNPTPGGRRGSDRDAVHGQLRPARRPGRGRDLQVRSSSHPKSGGHRPASRASEIAERINSRLSARGPTTSASPPSRSDQCREHGRVGVGDPAPRGSAPGRKQLVPR